METTEFFNRVQADLDRPLDCKCHGDKVVEGLAVVATINGQPFVWSPDPDMTPERVETLVEVAR